MGVMNNFCINSQLHAVNALKITIIIYAPVTRTNRATSPLRCLLPKKYLFSHPEENVENCVLLIFFSSNPTLPILPHLDLQFLGTHWKIAACLSYAFID